MSVVVLDASYGSDDPDSGFSPNVYIKTLINMISFQNNGSKPTIYKHAVSQIHIVGLITELAIYEEKAVLRVDDGTGILIVHIWNQEMFCTNTIKCYTMEDLHLGMILSLYGKIAFRENELYMTAFKVRIEEDFHAFLLHKIDVINLSENVYKKKNSKTLSLSEELKRYISENSGSTFSLTDITRDSKILYAPECSELSLEKCNRAILDELNNLIENGFIHKIDNVYKVTSPESLKGDIIEVLKEHENTYPGKFMKIKMITIKLKTWFPENPSVNSVNVNEAVFSLVRDGILYQSSQFDCKLVQK